MLRSTTGGIKYGLKLDLNVSNYYDFNELVVYIHNQSENPTNLRNKGYRIYTGSVSYFEIDRIFDEKLTLPFNDCFKNVSFFNENKTLINFLEDSRTRYSQVECIRYCRRLYLLEESKCNCAKSLDDISDCEHGIYKECYDKYLSSFQSRNVFKLCSKYCPLECDSFRYFISVHDQKLPVSGVINYNLTSFNMFETFEKMQREFVSINVYFLELHYTNIKQLAKTEKFDLISKIGGILGLFLGMSFLSFIEFIDLFLQIIFIFISYLKSKF